MNSKKMGFLALSLMIPGAGQIAAKRRLIGVLQILLSVICLGWAVLSIFSPVITSIHNLLQDKAEPIVKIGPSYFVGMLIPIAALVLTYTWSVLDIMLFVKKDDVDQPS